MLPDFWPVVHVPDDHSQYLLADAVLIACLSFVFLLSLVQQTEPSPKTATGLGSLSSDDSRVQISGQITQFFQISENKWKQVDTPPAENTIHKYCLSTEFNILEKDETLWHILYMLCFIYTLVKFSTSIEIVL